MAVRPLQATSPALPYIVATRPSATKAERCLTMFVVGVGTDPHHRREYAALPVVVDPHRSRQASSGRAGAEQCDKSREVRRHILRPQRKKTRVVIATGAITIETSKIFVSYLPKLGVEWCYKIVESPRATFCGRYVAPLSE